MISFHSQTVVFRIQYSPSWAMEIFLKYGKRYETKTKDNHPEILMSCNREM